MIFTELPQLKLKLMPSINNFKLKLEPGSILKKRNFSLKSLVSKLESQLELTHGISVHLLTLAKSKNNSIVVLTTEMPRSSVTTLVLLQNDQPNVLNFLRD